MTDHPAGAIRQRARSFLNGETRLFGIVGHPVVQTRSPGVFSHEFHARGVNAVLVPIDLSPWNFATAFPALLAIDNLDGLVITVPHKAAVLPWLDRIAPRAAAGGAVSVLARALDGKWVGDLFDGAGCCAAIEARGAQLDGRTVQLLGAGGAGSSIALEVLTRAPRELRIHDPDDARLTALLARLLPHAGTARVVTGLGPADILINASPVGMHAPKDCPFPAELLTHDMIVMDCVTEPEITRLLDLALRCGAIAVTGREMFDSQVDAVCDFFAHVKKSSAEEVVFHR
jgi:shikimate dehydrogenase